MSENRQEKCCKFLKSFPSDKCPILTSDLDPLEYRNLQDEGDATFCTVSEEITEVDHLLTEPQNHATLDEDPMFVTSEDRVNCLGFEDFPCSNDCYELNTDYGVLNSMATQDGKHEPKFEFSDDMFQALAEEKNLFLTGDLLSTCPDYLLDVQFPEKSSHLYYAPTEDPCLQNVDSGCNSQPLQIDGGSTEMLELSKAVIPLPESISDQSTLFLDEMSIAELHEAFRNTFGRDTFINDKEWIKRRILFGLQDIKESEKVSGFLENGLSSNENDDSLVFFPNIDFSGVQGSLSTICGSRTLTADTDTGKGKHASRSIRSSLSEVDNVKLLDLGNRDGERVARKRLRKPTRRYIEESSNKKSRNCNEKLEGSVSSSWDRVLHDKTQLQCQGSGVIPLVCAGESLIASGNQLTCTIRARRGRPRKSSTLMLKGSKGNKDLGLHSPGPKRIDDPGLSESESQGDMSDDFAPKIRKVGVRRKHHRLWTLSEVMKLIEGVSRYGVGRWTEIKRLLFSSSAYRTSVDLKDKWRNLLRATGAHIHGKKEVEPSKKHMSLPIPQSVTRRVRELSIIYPYPRDRKSRSPIPAASTPITDGDDTPMTCSGRSLHRRRLK